MNRVPFSLYSRIRLKVVRPIRQIYLVKLAFERTFPFLHDPVLLEVETGRAAFFRKDVTKSEVGRF